MSLNLEHLGIPIATIISNNTEQKKKNQQIISLDDNGDARNPFNDLVLTDTNQKFQVIGDPNRERDIIYVTGRSGSGKSYFMKEWVNNYYKKMYKKRQVYLFSALKEDPTIDQINGLNRIILDTDFLNENEITVSDFAESCVIFDDTDVITNKQIRDKINHIMDEILQTGRHHKISCLISKHTCCNGKDTKMILNESHQYVIFPQGLGNKSLKYLLDSYMGLDNQQIKRIKSQRGRWVSINRSTFPMTVVSEKECFILTNIETV
jgi:hypothetical protein